MKRIFFLFVLLIFIQTGDAFTVSNCDLITTGGNVTVGGNQSDTVHNCINGTYYNFTVNSTETVTNISYSTDASALVYQIRYLNGTIIANTSLSYYNTTNLTANNTYQIVKITSGWNETYILSGAAATIILAYGLWNRKRK